MHHFQNNAYLSSLKFAKIYQMKTRYILLATVLVFGLSRCTTNTEETTDQTPEIVLNTFAKMFPDATEVEWEAEDENEWEADFVVGEIGMSAEFSANGKWLETETELHKADVPKMVVEAVLAKYPKCEWREFSEVRSEDFMAYEVEIIHQGEEVELLVTGSGEILENAGEEEEEEMEV